VRCSEDGHHSREGVLEQSCSPHGGQEAVRGGAQDNATKASVTYFLPLGPVTSFHHLLITPSNHESISGFSHPRSQSPYEPITSQSLDPPAGDQEASTLEFFGGHFISKP
jgi:hypothetical protein